MEKKIDLTNAGDIASLLNLRRDATSIDVKKVKEFIKNNKVILKTLKEYIAHTETAPFQLDEPILGPDDQVYLVKTIEHGFKDWSHIEATDRFGVTKRFRIEEVKKYSLKGA